MKEVFQSYILPGILIAFIGFLGFGILGKVKNHNAVYDEVSRLSESLETIKEENEMLRSQINSFESSETIDKEARERLNLKKKDEHVVVILPPDEERIETTIEEEIPTEEKSSWWEKLKNLFF